jgi:hypothetical protein
MSPSKKTSIVEKENIKLITESLENRELEIYDEVKYLDKRL